MADLKDLYRRVQVIGQYVPQGLRHNRYLFTLYKAGRKSGSGPSGQTKQIFSRNTDTEISTTNKAEILAETEILAEALFSAEIGSFGRKCLFRPKICIFLAYFWANFWPKHGILAEIDCFGRKKCFGRSPKKEIAETPKPKHISAEIFGRNRTETVLVCPLGLYVVARKFFLLLLNCSAWLCLGPA